MKVELCLLFALVTIACSIPVPDEEISGAARSAAENAEKKINLIEDEDKSKAASIEVKEEKKAPESNEPELKKIPEEPKEDKPAVVAEEAKEEQLAERKLDDAVSTEVEAKSDVKDPAVVPEVKSLPAETKAEPELPAALEGEKKAELLPEPLAAEAKEIKEESIEKKDELKSDESNDEKKSEELKSDERKEKSESEKSAEDASGPLEEPVVAAVASKSAQSEPESREVPDAVAPVDDEQVARAAVDGDAAVQPVLDAKPSADLDAAGVLPEEPKIAAGKKIDNSSESQESDEKHDDSSKESSESDEDKSSA